jgi:hypothetical protein
MAQEEKSIFLMKCDIHEETWFYLGIYHYYLVQCTFLKTGFLEVTVCSQSTDNFILSCKFFVRKL